MLGGDGEIGEHIGFRLQDAENRAEHGDTCTMSFAPETQVAAPGGKRIPIVALKVGDQVLAYDPHTGKAGVQTVEHTSINHDTNLLDVTLRITRPAHATTGQGPAATRTTAQRPGQARTLLAATGTSTMAHDEDEVVHTTANHPWFTADHGWLPASFLRLGEQVVRVDGTTATVVAIRTVPGAASMWDLTVSNVHTFAVGAGAYVVHNATCDEFQQAREKAKLQLEDSMKEKHIANSMNKRGWTREEMLDTIENGEGKRTADITGGIDNPDPATRFTNPNTGRALTVNNTTGRVKMLGDVGFEYDLYDNIATRLWG